MDLREEFEKETGSNAYSQGFQHKLYNEKYVEWLEQRLDAGQHETVVNALTSRKHHWINESRRLVIEEPGSHEQKDATHMYGVYIDAVDDMKTLLKEGH